MARQGNQSSSLEGFFVFFTKVLSFVLGAYEFYACYKGWSGKQNSLFPSIYMRERILYAAYILTLGLQRLTFSAVSANILSWVCLIGTHMVEAWLWWSLAIEKYQVDTSSHNFTEMISITLSRVKNQSEYVLLYGVPFLCLLFTLTLVITLATQRKAFTKSE